MSIETAKGMPGADLDHQEELDYSEGRLGVTDLVSVNSNDDSRNQLPSDADAS